MYAGYGPYGLIGILVLVLDIIAIISVVAGKSSVERKLLWTLAILILPFLGMILYFLIGKKSTDVTVV